MKKILRISICVASISLALVCYCSKQRTDNKYLGNWITIKVMMNSMIMDYQELKLKYMLTITTDTIYQFQIVGDWFDVDSCCQSFFTFYYHISGDKITYHDYKDSKEIFEGSFKILNDTLYWSDNPKELRTYIRYKEKLPTEKCK